MDIKKNNNKVMFFFLSLSLSEVLTQKNGQDSLFLAHVNVSNPSGQDALLYAGRTG